VTALTIALSKGRILDESLPLLASAGLVPLEHPDTSRKLILPTNREGVSLVVLRATDVPTYVQYGAADLGIAGKDVLLEQGGEGLYQPLDLRIARCRLVVATRRGYDWAGLVQRGARVRVATKYVRTAREHFASKGMHVDLIKLHGSMELAPLAGSPTRSWISCRRATRCAPTTSSRSRTSCRSRAADRQSGRAQAQARRREAAARRAARRGARQAIADERAAPLLELRGSMPRDRASTRRSTR
jgi:ATP phosphoribosyltransferase